MHLPCISSNVILYTSISYPLFPMPYILNYTWWNFPLISLYYKELDKHNSKNSFLSCAQISSYIIICRLYNGELSISKYAHCQFKWVNAIVCY